MPDVWTANPGKLRNMLDYGGFECGREPRIYKDRDAQWTCAIDGEGWYGDVYIHHLSTSWTSGPTSVFICMAFTIGIALGYVVAQRSAGKKDPLKLR